MTFDDYYRNNVNGKKLEKDSKARIVAITKGRNANSGDSILVPCGDEVGVSWTLNALEMDVDKRNRPIGDVIDRSRISIF